jgi:hypothetical protein
MCPKGREGGRVEEKTRLGNKSPGFYPIENWSQSFLEPVLSSLE